MSIDRKHSDVSIDTWFLLIKSNLISSLIRISIFSIFFLIYVFVYFIFLFILLLSFIKDLHCEIYVCA